MPTWSHRENQHIQMQTPLPPPPSFLHCVPSGSAGQNPVSPGFLPFSPLFLNHSSGPSLSYEEALRLIASTFSEHLTLTHLNPHTGASEQPSTMEILFHSPSHNLPVTDWCLQGKIKAPYYKVQHLSLCGLSLASLFLSPLKLSPSWSRLLLKQVRLNFLLHTRDLCALFL